MPSTAIGIDLGTTNSVVAVHINGRTNIIGVDGSKITPSFVFFDPEDITNVCVGDVEEAVSHPYNGIYDTKRMIGRSFDDEWIQSFANNSLFHIERSPTSGILIGIKQGEKMFYKTPQEISAEILKELKNSASEYLKEKVTEAVITVPAYFNFSQRNATKQAAILAGLKVLMLLNEPTAAALHYIQERIRKDTSCLIFDLGGGTFDVAIVNITNNNIQTEAVDGDTFLGGRNFDEITFNYIVHKYNMNLNETQKRRLMSSIVEVKQKLSYKNSYSKVIECFYIDKGFVLKLSRKEFETICDDLYTKCLDIVKRCLQNAGLDKNDIHKVILVGGSSKIPKIETMISDFFGEKKVLKDLNPDEAVAKGAAIQAACMKGDDSIKFHISDVTPFSLGLCVHGCKMEKLFKRNTPLPATAREYFTTVNNFQTFISLRIYEGERSYVKYNNLLGEFVLRSLPKRLADEVKIVVTFTIDVNGLLKVTAKEESTKISEELEIDTKLHDLKTKRIQSSAEEIEEDRLFEEFLDQQQKVKSRILNYVDNIGDIQEIQTCSLFIENVEAVEFENRHKLGELINNFKLSVSDDNLIEILESFL